MNGYPHRLVLGLAIVALAGPTAGAGARESLPALPDARPDDLAAAAGWRAGDVSLPSPGSAPGTVNAADGCSTPDDDRCEAWAQVAGQQFDSVRYGTDWAYGAEMSPDGRHMFVAGTSSLGTFVDTDVQISSFDPSTGAVQWISRRDGGLGLADVVYDVTVSPDSSKVFVVGASVTTRPVQGSDILTIAFDAATGATLWQRAADPSGAPDLAYTARVSTDGSTLVVAGYANNGNDPIAIAYSTTAGDELWTATDPGSASGRAVDVAVGSDAAYLLAYNYNGKNQDSVAYALDLDDGERRWTSRFDGGKHERPTAVAIDEEHGRMYVLSGTDVDPKGAEYGLAAFELVSGDEVWRANFAGARAESNNIPTTLLVVPDRDPERDGAVVIASGLLVNNGPSDYDFGTVAYDGATGAELWNAVYGSDRDERVWDMALSADLSTLYVTGRSGPPYVLGPSAGTAVDAATVSYDTATGQRRWAARYAGSSATEAGGDPEGVGVTPDGSRVVTGGTMVYTSDASAVNAKDFVAVGYDESG